MASKVFISWGGDLSKSLAEEIRHWLPSVLQFVKPYFTPSDIEKGARWESHVADELNTSDVGIICLTKDNIDRPWILFEAGALSKNFGKANVCTILFDVDSSNLSGPLSCFQTTKFEKNDFAKLIQTINDTGGDSKLDSSVLNDVFDMWWPKLESRVKDILANYKPETPSKRPEREILEEILELSRINLRQPNRMFMDTESALIQFVESLIDYQIKSPIPIRENGFLELRFLHVSVERLCMMLGCPQVYDRYISTSISIKEGTVSEKSKK